MIKISFDFDETLDRVDVQSVLEVLRAQYDLDVWVFTSRMSDSKAPSKAWNDDLKKVVSDLNIPLTKVVFCNDIPKSQVISDYDFDIHVDDDWEDCESISSVSSTKTVKCLHNDQWRKELVDLIESIDSKL